MSRNRGENTGPEIRLRKACFALGLRFRLRYPLPGKPDFVFPGQRLAVFVDGCFWHGCPQHYNKPATRADFWASKLERNRDLDVRVAKALQELGWSTLRVWEHEVRADVEAVAQRVQAAVAAAQRLAGRRRPG
jgi:DNA mismatch endonuclease (patch repair protein)